MSDSMQSSHQFSSIIIHDEAQNLLICLLCQFSILSSQDFIMQHLKRKHKEFSLTECQDLIERLSCTNALLLTDLMSWAAAEALSYSSDLVVIHDSLQCCLLPCIYHADTLATMHKHQQITHLLQAPHIEFITVSTLFLDWHQHFFSVVIPAHSFRPLDPAEANKRMTLAHLNNSFLNHWHQKHEVLVYSSQDLSHFEQTSWDLRTNWFKIFTGKAMNVAAALTLLLTLKDSAVYAVILILTIHHYIWCIHEGVKHLSHYVSQLFYFVDSSCLFKKSFTPIQDTSVLNYEVLWQ